MTVNERLDRHDRQIAAIRNLVQEGMRLMVEQRKDMHAFRQELRSLAAAQKKTDAMLQDLIRSLKTGGNGHRKGNLKF